MVVLLSFLQSLVQFLSPFLHALSSLPEQHAMVHLLSLQLPEQVQSFPLQPPFPAIAGTAMKAVIPTNAIEKISFFIMFLYLTSNIHIKQTQIGFYVGKLLLPCNHI